MQTYDNDGKIISTPPDIQIDGKPACLILVTHDESTFYANDRRKTKWIHESQKAAPEPKGEGQSLMVSDFLTVKEGRLKHEGNEARIVFKAGKNRDGYFTADDLLKQVENAVNIFDARYQGNAVGLFIFNNAPSHQKRAEDALSAHKLPKKPTTGWTHHKNGKPMRNGRFTDGSEQQFYFPDSHPTMPG
ncbi:hypothetical protein M422DRAFT_240406 [Sphaerobolus stellatus SS14]|nr:hypothetical protein M422DRAFT_240406 [Sphaerobolus stellatus SS14]